jgi:CheY-like chemotaxis protein
VNDKTLDILLVGDDQVDVANVRRALEENNLSTPLHLAGSGVEALELLRGGKVPRGRRLVLLDLNASPRIGLDFLRELRADPALRTTSVVLLTTSNDERDRAEAYDLNVAGYLLKPIPFPRFVELMATLLAYWTIMEFP